MRTDSRPNGDRRQLIHMILPKTATIADVLVEQGRTHAGVADGKRQREVNPTCGFDLLI